MQKYGSSVGVSSDQVDRSIDPTPFEFEDAHSQIISQLVDGVHYDLVQLDPIRDPDVVGLIVDGRLRVTYTKANTFTDHSVVAETILARAKREALKAHAIVRDFERAVPGSMDTDTKRGPDKVHASMGAEPTTGQTEALTNFLDEYILDELPESLESRIPEVMPVERFTDNGFE